MCFKAKIDAERKILTIIFPRLLNNKETNNLASENKFSHGLYIVHNNGIFSNFGVDMKCTWGNLLL